MKKYILLLVFIFSSNCNKNSEKLSNEKLLNVILVTNYLDTLCNYRMVKTNITEIPTITIPSSGKYRVCGNETANLRVVFADYTKKITISGNSGSFSNGCPGSTTSTISSYMTESDSSSATSTEIYNSVTIPNVIFQPQKSKSYLISSLGVSSISSYCTQNNASLVSTKDFNILFSVN